MHESCRVCMSHVTYAWVIRCAEWSADSLAAINFIMWLSVRDVTHVTYEWVMTMCVSMCDVTLVTCEWISSCDCVYVTWLMSYTNESWLCVCLCVTWHMSHVNEFHHATACMWRDSCHIRMSHDYVCVYMWRDACHMWMSYDYVYIDVWRDICHTWMSVIMWLYVCVVIQVTYEWVMTMCVSMCDVTHITCEWVSSCHYVYVTWLMSHTNDSWLCVCLYMMWRKSHFSWRVLQHCTGFARLFWGRLRVHRAFVYSDWFVCYVTHVTHEWIFIHV